MLLRQSVLDGIRRGAVTLAFRRWRRPTVRSGGTLLTAAGQLSIASVAPVTPESISDADAARAGYDSRDALLAELNRRTDGTVYRIELGRLEPDPRMALRERRVVDETERRRLADRLARLDDAAAVPWVRVVLAAIDDHPGVRAADLCRVAGGDGKGEFKIKVRKLKALGLTESLRVGYRLSPRGRDVLQWLADV